MTGGLTAPALSWPRLFWALLRLNSSRMTTMRMMKTTTMKRRRKKRKGSTCLQDEVIVFAIVGILQKWDQFAILSQ
jgi:hypothetical protein